MKKIRYSFYRIIGGLTPFGETKKKHLDNMFPISEVNPNSGT